MSTGYPKCLLAAQNVYWLPKKSTGCPKCLLAAQNVYWLPKKSTGCPKNLLATQKSILATQNIVVTVVARLMFFFPAHFSQPFDMKFGRSSWASHTHTYTPTHTHIQYTHPDNVESCKYFFFIYLLCDRGQRGA